MKILISAAEASSDAHGAELLRALKAMCAERGLAIEAFGVGGPALQAEGLRAEIDARELLAMGFTEVLGKLPRAARALRQLERLARAERPALAVVIDYPDFHMRLAARLKRLGIPVIYYIPPKVWAWRKGRIHKLRTLFDRLICILPFEEEMYREQGVRATYVGNPLVDELPLGLTRAAARAGLTIGPGEKVLALLPGSRPGELKHHLEPMLGAALLTARGLKERGALGGKLIVLMPLPRTADVEGIRARVARWLARASAAELLEVCVSQGDAPTCLAAADAGLIKSGTSTLEAGLMGCPHAVVYRPSALSSLIFRHIVRYRGPVGLVNLLADTPPGERWLAREILCGEVTAETLAEEALALFTDEGRRARIDAGLARLRNRLNGAVQGLGPSAAAAREVLRALPAGP